MELVEAEIASIAGQSPRREPAGRQQKLVAATWSCQELARKPELTHWFDNVAQRSLSNLLSASRLAKATSCEPCIARKCWICLVTRVRILAILCARGENVRHDLSIAFSYQFSICDMGTIVHFSRCLRGLKRTCSRCLSNLSSGVHVKMHS